MLAASSAAFIVLRANNGLETRFSWASGIGHFWVVSAAAIACAVLAVAAGVAAQQAKNARILMLALAFLSMAGFFTVHGLSTPGVLMEAGRGAYTVTTTPAYSAGAAPSGAIPVPAAWLFNFTGLSGRLAVSAAALFLAASAVQWAPPVERAIVRWRHGILGGLVALIALYGVVGLRRPEVVPQWLAGTEWVAWSTMAVVVALGLWAAWRYATGYVRSGLAMYGAVALGAVLLVQAQLSMQYGAIWQGTFWLYHLQLLAGFSAILWGVVVEYSRGRTVQSFAALTVSDALDQLQAGYAEPVVALAKALETRDGYTIGHGERVAAMSVLIGQELRLPAPSLRALAAGALLHDVGKIGIPDAILHKNGRLTDEEFGVIQEHPGRGHEILRFIYSQQEESLVIRHHHEKWDGSGYPDRLSGEAIPLGARIAAVADVYDALRSNRSYRTPMTPEEAQAVIREGAGKHFDPRCVEAFLAVAGQWETRHAAAHVPYSERRTVTA
ncbi:MAG: hypothetical protein AMXMBFR23_15770 [Chloroflexota bacterium]